ncbi:winged helix DNA-binding domain-containing protein [Hyalangium gracile]|uniref:winged helix DNA-binding domain-containing protein n=1 Tax=Hyalangium gracile TaxID=394092 RepID=UPI001CCDF24C|nr:winged helix DNA-binding domain-containing protein [Hyalangium gracile]
MKFQQIAQYRLQQQQIARTRFKTPGQIVSWLGALQAQDYPGAKWSIGLRLPDTTDADVEQAIADGAIVRSWPMRGTLHIVAPEDLRWMLALLAPRNMESAALRHRQIGLTAARFSRSQKLFTKALQGGQALTRDELYAVLERARLSTDSQRGYHFLWRAAQEGLICFGPTRGKQQTFVLLDEWVPASRKLDREESLAELAMRYFTSHGPATLQDFLWWSGLKAAEARAALDSVSSRLEQVTVDGQEYWLARDLRAPRAASPTAYLLPGFDEYMLGYTDRGAVVAPEHRKKWLPTNGMFSPIVVIDGQVLGTWKRTLKKKALVVTVRSFVPLSKAQKRAVEAAAEPYGRFMGAPVELSF